MKRTAWFSLLAGLLPIVAVNVAFWLNVQAGLPGCFPYIDGCYSVSRGVRDGPGLWVFKASALPAALLMALTWRNLPEDLAGRWARRLGLIGAAALVLYALGLGTDGEFYKWMRRYGVVFFFGLTGVAPLVVATSLWRGRAGRAGGGVRPEEVLYLSLAALTWAVGLLSAFKRRLFDDPNIVDQVENAAEWGFSLGLGLLFVALGMVLARRHSPGT